MKSSIIFLLILNLSLIYCAPDGWPKNIRNLIVGGSPATIEEFPFIGLMTLPGKCGCSILSTQFVLTAAHCVTDKKTGREIAASSIKLRFGSIHQDKDGEISNVVSINRHPNYNEYNMDFDFALMKLDRNLNFGSTIKPIKMSTQTYVEGTDVVIAGWGRVVPNRYFSGTLQKAQVELLNYATCKHNYKNEGFTLTNQMMCAGSFQGGVDTCLGDSGGPLVVKKNGEYLLIGVTSWGIGCAKKSLPGIYGELSQVSEWINNILVKDSITADYPDDE